MWKPKLGWNSGKGKAKADQASAEGPEPEDDDDDPILDPEEGSDLRDEEDGEEEPEEEEQAPEPAPTPTPAAGGSNLPAADATAARLASLEAENARLRAEATKLQAQLGEQTLPNAQKAARVAAVRLFGQGTPQLTEAKKLITACETVADAERLTASWELALSATPLAANAGARQTNRAPVTTDPNATTAARAKAAVNNTRPRSVKPGESKE